MTVPDWAEEAFSRQAPLPGWKVESPNPVALAKHQARCDRWRQRWLELSTFVKNVGHLPDAGKTLVLERAFYVGEYLSPNKTREARRELESINSQIIDHLSTAVSLLNQRHQIRPDFALSDGMADLFDALEDAINRYPTWAYVAKNETRAFLRMRGQTRARPAMADLLEAFIMLSRTAVETPMDDVIDVSQKPDADHIRTMLMEIGHLNSECLDQFNIDEKFRITDAAIAELINVAFDLPAEQVVDAGTVKRRRQAAEKEGYDYWNGAK